MLVGDVVAVTFDLQASGFFSGSVLENATVTATGNGTARDNGSSTANGGGAFIVATTVSNKTIHLEPLSLIDLHLTCRRLARLHAVN